MRLGATFAHRLHLTSVIQRVNFVTRQDMDDGRWVVVGGGCQTTVPALSFIIITILRNA